jgi:hypothetical protein
MLLLLPSRGSHLERSSCALQDSELAVASQSDIASV